jgi:uracil-DNA glycosylase family 4
MDEDCRNCPALCETRTEIVHGYGPVDADFLFVGERPDPEADVSGIPFAGSDENSLFDLLARLDLCSDPDAEEPPLENVFLTLLTRCRHPERPPTDEEVRNCEPFLDAEIRSINPEVLVPVGARALEEIATEYTTRPAGEFDVETHAGERIRGRGFELFPMPDPATADDEALEEFLAAFADLLEDDYRQTKGRRRR